jgi:hypothetical protein
MMQSIKINNPGVKITVDGSVVRREKLSIETSKNSRATEQVRTVQLRRNSLEKEKRVRTEFMAESSINSIRELPSTKRGPKEQNVRVATEASRYTGSSKGEKISVENYSLRKLVIESEEDG